MLSKTTFGIVLCLACARVSFSQEMPKPGPEHQMLHELVGTWDAEMNMGGQKSKATVVYKSICDGMWLSSEFDGELAGMKFRGHGLDGYDQHKKKYVGVWVDSWTSGPMNMEGDYDPKSKKLVLTGEMRGPDGKLQKCKSVTETKDKDNFTFQMFGLPAGGQEDLMFSIEYTRHK